MFYKEEYIHAEEIKNIKAEYPHEFIFALYKKMSSLDSNYVLGYLVKEKEDIKTMIRPIIINKVRDIYIKTTGFSSSISYLKSKASLYNHDCDSIFVSSMSEQEFSAFGVDMRKVEEISSHFKSFHNLASQVVVEDKNKEQYVIKIIKNADPTILDRVAVDKVMLLKDGQEIGYVLAKYISEDTANELNCEDLSKDDFYKTATIDYSSLDEKYRNKGLGYVMYYHMAKHLNQEGIRFRSSYLQSDSAVRLWEGIHTHFKEHIKSELYKQREVVSFLNIGRDTFLEFHEKKPVIKNHFKI